MTGLETSLALVKKAVLVEMGRKLSKDSMLKCERQVCILFYIRRVECGFL